MRVPLLLLHQLVQQARALKPVEAACAVVQPEYDRE